MSILPGPCVESTVECWNCEGKVFYFHAYGHEGLCWTCEKLIKDLLDKFDSVGEHGENVLTNESRQTDVMAIEVNCEKILTPLQRFEHGLHPWSSFLIMPLFALANAGVTLKGMDLGAALTSSVSIGIIAGLFLGKQLGICFRLAGC